jgi:multiple sugar transport system permease protein
VAAIATNASGAPRPGRLWRYRWCYLFMIPSVLLTILFTLYPAVMSWYFSFLDWSGFSNSAHFIGVGNYRELLHDGMFWDAFGRSLLFVVVAVPIRLVLSLVIAIALNNQALKLSPLFRTMFFLPVVTTAAIVGVVMSLLYSPFNGPINDALMGIGLVHKPVDFLGSPGTSLWSVMAVEIWKNLGITMIYWLAALQTVPRAYTEAAALDGAGRWQQLRHVTGPLLLPFAAIITLLTANTTLHTFGIVQTMTGGGPYFSSQTVEVYIYQTAFAPGGGAVPRLGYASAAGCLFGLCIMLIALLQVWAGRRVAQIRAQLREVP